MFLTRFLNKKKNPKEELEQANRKEIEQRNIEHQQVVGKESEAWTIQLEEMQQLEINWRQEFADKIERQRVENNFELEKHKLELEQQKIDLEARRV